MASSSGMDKLGDINFVFELKEIKNQMKTILKAIEKLEDSNQNFVRELIDLSKEIEEMERETKETYKNKLN